MKLYIEIFLLVIASFNIGIIIISLLYNKILYKRFYLPGFRKDYSPGVAVFVPCKGLEDNLEDYLEAIAVQDYPDYRVYFITESDEDPAVKAIREVVSKHGNTYHVISGKTSTCCQKNHNLLKAIEQDSKSDVFIFADADVRPAKGWIRDLVLPLSRDDVPVSTGFRWLTPKKFSFYATIHSMLSAYICTLMSTSKGVWGGSMAIRRKEYEKYNVGEVWSKTVVDDISLTEIIIKNRIKRIFVPHCIAVSTNVLDSFKDDVEWFTRQLMFLKTYCRSLWAFAVVFHSLVTIMMYIAFLGVISVVFIPSLKGYMFILLLFLIVSIVSTGLIKFNYDDNQSFFLWVLFTLPGQMIAFICLLKSVIQKDIIWRNIRYKLNDDGTVRAVQFL